MMQTLYELAGAAPDGQLVELSPAERPELPPDCLLSAFDIMLTHVGRGRARAEMTIAPIHLNQRGVVQAGALVAFADAVAGWATYASVAHGGFTTLELRTNLVRPARTGDVLHAEARGLHLGRRTALFDVDVQAGDRLVARFGCTQLIVEPGPAAGNQP
jgi:uncharacterized protein (TIGR00369 family)